MGNHRGMKGMTTDDEEVVDRVERVLIGRPISLNDQGIPGRLYMSPETGHYKPGYVHKIPSLKRQNLPLYVVKA